MWHLSSSDAPSELPTTEDRLGTIVAMTEDIGTTEEPLHPVVELHRPRPGVTEAETTIDETTEGHDPPSYKRLELEKTGIAEATADFEMPVLSAGRLVHPHRKATVMKNQRSAVTMPTKGMIEVEENDTGKAMQAVADTKDRYQISVELINT